MVNVMAHLHVVEKGLEHQGAGVARVEEHQLGLLQVIGREALLDLRPRLRSGKPQLLIGRMGFLCVRVCVCACVCV